MFRPLRDLTCAVESYSCGRYLLDIIKNADLGQVADGPVTDFNSVYNPGCGYNARWVCPLALLENRLGVRVQAGEQRYPDGP